jgi:hypothetical protein
VAKSPPESFLAIITGRVVNDRGEFMKGVTVLGTVLATRAQAEDPPKFEATTDLQGRYSLRIPLKPGEESGEVEFVMAGYEAAPSVCQNCGAVEYVDLAAGKTSHASCVLQPIQAAVMNDQQRTVKINSSAKPEVFVTGRILNQSGEGIPGALVRVAVPASDMRRVFPGSGHKTIDGRTSNDGVYKIRIPMNAATTISVDAMKPGYGSASGTFRSGGEIRNLSVIPGSKPAASFILKPALYVAGIIVDEKGEPVSDVGVSALMRDRNSYSDIEQVVSQGSGAFELFDFPLQADANRRSNGDDKASQGELGFRHPDYSRQLIQDIYKLTPEQQTSLRVVLSRGLQIAGQLMNQDGLPATNVMVEAHDSQKDRKATLTDEQGRFAIAGLAAGEARVRAHALGLRQKIDQKLSLAQDQHGLRLRLQPAPLPANLETATIFGMKLANINEELGQLYDHERQHGVVVIDPGTRFKNLGLIEGDVFVSIGEGPIADLRSFRSAVLAEAALQTGDPIGCRVVYLFSRVGSDGSNTTIIELKRSDIDELKQMESKLPRGAPLLGVGIIPTDECRIGRVLPDSLAEKAGLKVDDVIIKLNGMEIPNARTLTEHVRKVRIGTVIPVEVRRGSETLILKVTFE